MNPIIEAVIAHLAPRKLWIAMSLITGDTMIIDASTQREAIDKYIRSQEDAIINHMHKHVYQRISCEARPDEEIERDARLSNLYMSMQRSDSAYIGAPNAWRVYTHSSLISTKRSRTTTDSISRSRSDEVGASASDPYDRLVRDNIELIREMMRDHMIQNTPWFSCKQYVVQ